MKKIKVNLTGGVLGPHDSIEYDGQEVPNIHKIVISAGVHEAPRVEIYAYCGITNTEFEADHAVIHKLTADGASVDDYESVVIERDMLRKRLGALEKQ
jgi:hypothetical protein